MTLDFSIQIFLVFAFEFFRESFLKGHVLLMCPPLPQKLQVVEGLALVDSFTK